MRDNVFYIWAIWILFRNYSVPALGQANRYVSATLQRRVFSILASRYDDYYGNFFTKGSTIFRGPMPHVGCHSRLVTWSTNDYVVF